MVINEIVWLDSVVEKVIWKHNVTPVEIEEIIEDKKHRIFKKEKGKVDGENLYNLLGKTNNGRYLSIFFIRKFNNKALIITARDMNKRERRRYARK